MSTKPLDPEVKTKTYKIPDIARSAINLLEAKHKESLNELSKQTIQALGGDLEDGDWALDFTKGTILHTPKAP